MKIYAVFGNPIAHSKSPFLHNYAYDKLHLDAKYTRYLLDSSDIKEIFFKLNLNGANVTVPFKEAAFNACDEVRGIAQKIGAVNTLVRENNHLIGYNTDAFGFYKNIENKNLKSALIIGAGGSAKAIAWILRQNNIRVIIVNRSKQNLIYFSKNGFECYLSNDLNNNLNIDLIINATSSSLKNELPLLDSTLKALFTRAKIAFDLMYGRKCAFLELAKKQNLACIDGKNMLIYQAAASAEIFFGINEIKFLSAMQEGINILGDI